MACGPEPGQHPQPRDTDCAWKGCRAVVQSCGTVHICSTEVNTEAFRVV